MNHCFKTDGKIGKIERCENRILSQTYGKNLQKKNLTFFQIQMLLETYQKTCHQKYPFSLKRTLRGKKKEDLFYTFANYKIKIILDI